MLHVSLWWRLTIVIGSLSSDGMSSCSLLTQHGVLRQNADRFDPPGNVSMEMINIEQVRPPMLHIKRNDRLVGGLLGSC